MEKINKLCTDWISSKPVFYNTNTGKISHDFYEVVDFTNLELDPEGFNNYLDFGYSVFEQTPIKNVKFLRHSSEVYLDENRVLHVENFKDPVEDYIDEPSEISFVIEHLSKSISEWESKFNGEIIIPTSGGYDSRILNFLINDKSRIRSFTYGISNEQHISSEVQYAKNLSKILNTQWEQIELDNFNKYIKEWNEIFGPYIHAHGMYHIEFYKKIETKIGKDKHLLSGIIGDAWAGSVKIDPIKTPDELIKLGYTHGMHADSKFSLLKSPSLLKKKYFEENKYKLTNPKWLVVEAMRFKMILLQYLIRVPEKIGFIPWSPFLELEVAMSMLNLPTEERRNRNWQKDFFQRNNILLDELKIQKDSGNTLNLKNIENTDFELIDVNIFEGILSEDYIYEINRILSNSRKSLKLKRIVHKILSKLYFIPKLESVLKMTKIDNYNFNCKEHNAYAAYLTIKPIENLLKMAIKQ